MQCLWYCCCMNHIDMSHLRQWIKLTPITPLEIDNLIFHSIIIEPLKKKVFINFIFNRAKLNAGWAATSFALQPNHVTVLTRVCFFFFFFSLLNFHTWGDIYDMFILLLSSCNMTHLLGIWMLIDNVIYVITISTFKIFFNNYL